ncbi:hypothetical protein ANDA3_3151 [plant metagenome]|uniref:Uncharacterized protein n=2 Tax=root TaxID=1 RepID=A0A1C3K425_9BURK|nr:hypothetical protein ODI_03594 [Orrella dioscoreae]SOE51046.1 hypothetical protein ODI_R3154 [Orrella dioscoreae]
MWASKATARAASVHIKGYSMPRAIQNQSDTVDCLQPLQRYFVVHAEPPLDAAAAA